MSSDQSGAEKRVIIEPKVLKGFRDILPAQELVRKEILAKLEATVRQYGFVPIDTPILEYTEVLLGKGGGETDKQVYRFTHAEKHDISMRFDLTVPFARFMAANRNELYLPFKRFHFAKVWRGENAQRGRYREFMQCDFDIVGVDALSADFEILLLMNRTFAELGIDGVRFHISHRGVFNRFLEHSGVRQHSVEILRTVDKIKKIGAEETRKLLSELVPAETADRIVSYVSPLGAPGADARALHALNLATLAKMEELAGGPAEDSERIRAILGMADELGIGGKFYLDPSITRGLDYYTGIVYETFLTELPAIGSVCSGGRYNDLASLYTKEQLPGVGSSIGIDRLIAGLEELGKLGAAPRGADVLILCQDEKLLGHYHAVAESCRKAGLMAEVFPQGKKLPVQFTYAERKSIPYGLIIGETEKAAETVNLKNLASRENHDGMALEAAIKLMRG
jgi:histidyl-tRNA synthetase